MIAVGLIRRGIGCALVAAVLSGAALVPASSAAALSPWWHLTSGARPSNLQPGLARDAVQEIAVRATGGEVVAIEPASLRELEEGEGELEFVAFPYNATHEVVQAELEKLYGAGNVQVAGGPGDATGSKPYRVTFTGGLADQPLETIDTQFSGFLGGLEGTAETTEATAGRADGEIVLTAKNVGDANVEPSTAPVSISDVLPPGLKGVAIRGGMPLSHGTINGLAPLRCSRDTLSCTIPASRALVPYDELEIRILVVVEPGASSGEMNEARASGGGAPSASIRRPITVSPAPTQFGVEDYELTPEEAGGMPDTQAGSHPFQTTFTLDLNQTADTTPLRTEPEIRPAALAKDLRFKLPTGLIGNPMPMPQCSIGDFLHNIHAEQDECAPQDAVGVASVLVYEPLLLGLLTFTVPLFNVEPHAGEPARFGFYLPLPELAVLIDTSVRSGGDYGVTGIVSNIPQTAAFLSSEVTYWGTPGDARHDAQRGWGCLALAREEVGQHPPCDPLEAHHPAAFLTLPTSCEGPMQSSVEADSWEQEGTFPSRSSDPLPALDGCNRLPFDPSIEAVPDSTAASTPTGLNVKIHVPQDVSLDAEGLSEADVRNTTVTLPAGIALNPAAADGLRSCTDVPEPGRPEGEIGLHEVAPPICPEASKVGLVKIKTPLLPNALEGAAYLAAQDQNPFGSLVALYVVAQDPVSGTLVKLAGEVRPDPVSGQLVSTFKDTPQLPFEDFELHFFGGDRAPLATPAACGDYTTSASIAPWSGNPPVSSSSTFQITSGPNGSPCANPLPFGPSLTAGMTSIQAGGFSPFTMTMSRGDGQQNLNSVTLRMPPGLLGTLSSVKLCGEPQADQGTCGPESLIGHTIVSVGVGGDPYTVTGGEVFITGPYKGAPYGLSIVNPAKAGPFDLGKVVVRAKIEVDQQTAQLTITTDESGPYRIPTILDGIPLQIQHVNVTIDRSQFTFNPTDCDPLAITGELTSSEAATAALSVPFQATNCAVLAFKPKLEASTSGKPSRANGTSLHVKLSYPAGPYDANISRVKVELPKALPSRLTTLQKACTAQVFDQNPANCPAASIVGHATATTPVLPVPLTGPAIFVSHGNESFPSLNIILQGYGATVHLVGTTFISPKGITSSTFKTVPDVPVGTFELTLPQGPYSALTTNTNPCKAKLGMPTEFLGQNGALIKTTTKIQTTGCPKAKKATHKRKAHKKPRRKTARGRAVGNGKRRRG